MFNYYAILAMALAAIAAISTIPFAAGLMGFSRRISYVLTAAPISALIYLEAITFPEKLKYQDAYQIALTDLWSVAVCTVELLIPSDSAPSLTTITSISPSAARSATEQLVEPPPTGV